jgi:glycerol-3-phosphate acyltransferase PlsX
MQQPVLAIDAMGGDAGAELVVPASLAFLERHPNVSILLVGDPARIEPFLLPLESELRARLELVPASQVVGMDEAPADALRRKKDSSMRVAINLVKEGRAHACVSAGNTGALMAISRFVLKTLPGIDRPAIISAIPARRGHTQMLDLGANADCSPQQLLQFAVMGTVIATGLHGVEHPRVGLLNIGTEDNKGNEAIRGAGKLLADSELNYVGFVEGNDIMSGRVDVVVTDGFTGNVALKTMEGLVRMLFQSIKDEAGKSWRQRLATLLAKPMLRSMQAKLDPRLYNGASLVGLQGIVIKSHGGADEVAFRNALRTALIEIRKDAPGQIGELMTRQKIPEDVL